MNIRTFLVVLLAVIASPVMAQFTIPPTSVATALGNSCFEITNATSQVSAVWSNNQLDLSQNQEIAFTFSMTNGAGAADGIALVLQTSGTATIGQGGNFLGYMNGTITPSFGVEIDLFDNSMAGHDDVVFDHVAIHINGDETSAIRGPAQANPLNQVISDGMCHEFRFVWTAATTTVEVFIDGSSRLGSFVYDIPTNVFGGGNMVFWGVTGGTGGSASLQTVCMGAQNTHANAGTDLSLCPGDTVQFNGTGGVGYGWAPGTPTVSNGSIADPTYTSTTPGMTPFILTVQDTTGCFDTDTLLVTVLTPPVADAGNSGAFCPGDSFQVGAAPVGALTYSWTPTTGLSDATSSQPWAMPAANTTYLLTVTDPLTSCTDTASVTVTIHPMESVDITLADTFTCNGASIDIVGTVTSPGIDILQWSPTTGVSDPSIANPTITPTVGTTYYLSGQNSNTGCGFTDSIRIETYQLAVSHWNDSTVCLGDTVTFDIQPTGGTGNYDYMWLSSSSDTVTDPTAGTTGLRPTQDGVFTVMVTDQATGCSITFVIRLQITRLTVTATPGSVQINPGQRVELEAAGAMFYSWAPDENISCVNCPNPVVRPQMSMTYTVTGTDTNNCTGIAIVNIIADSLVIQNVFTPNGDDINDQLMLNYYGDGNYQISVFDRWGVQHFNTTDTNASWNGLNGNGTPVPEGVYYLVVRIVGDDSIPEKDKQRVFHVTLLR